MTVVTQDIVQLLDWRRRMLELYGDVRTLLPDEPEVAHRRWRAARDDLVGRHPQSPLVTDLRLGFPGLAYFAYDPAFAFAGAVEPAEEQRFDLPTSTGGTMAFVRFGRVRLPVGALDLYWLDAYGGGLLLPFRDATGGVETYGGGRYLLDTAKGADLGSTDDGQLVLDFNFAYNPSCHYRDDWTCPLPPSANRLDSRIAAGERSFTTPGQAEP